MSIRIESPDAVMVGVGIIAASIAAFVLSIMMVQGDELYREHVFEAATIPLIITCVVVLFGAGVIMSGIAINDEDEPIKKVGEKKA